MSYGETDTFDWSDIRKIDEWLDMMVSAPYRDQPMALDIIRIAKGHEEFGEAVAAYIGATGQNPRKGFTHNKRDVLDEIADAVLTGVVAIQHFTKDDWETKTIIMERLQYRMRKMKEAQDK